MSKHRHHHKKCCSHMMDYSMYGMGGFGAPAVYGGSCQGAAGIRWLYALLILIVIVLQFSKRDRTLVKVGSDYCGEVAAARDEIAVTTSGGFLSSGGSEIDNSVLFIIVVFLLILCSGCLGGRTGSGYGAGFGGFGGGYGYF